MNTKKTKRLKKNQRSNLTLNKIILSCKSLMNLIKQFHKKRDFYSKFKSIKNRSRQDNLNKKFSLANKIKIIINDFYNLNYLNIN